MDEGSRWSHHLLRALTIAVLGGAAIDLAAVIGDPSTLIAYAMPRAVSMMLVSAFAATVHFAPDSTVARVDGRGRASLWALAILAAVTTGMAARVPISFTLVAVAMAFLPAGMRKMTVPRWLVGGSAWVVTALLVSVATRGAPATFTRAVLFGLAPGVALFFGVFLLGYTSKSPHRDTAAELEGGALGGYQLKRRLGAGGMGEVWEAQHPALKVSVAVKLLRIQSRVARGRFEVEARATARLSHPNTVRIFDYGIVGDGLAYYVMEYVPGTSLKQLVEQEGPLPPARAIRMARQIASALHEAHELGLVHRDVKPDNVLLQGSDYDPDFVKVIDFGLVYRGKGREEGERFTRPGTVVGTPSYLAPEASAGGNASPAADVYSLGCLLYFLLTGAPPFVGETVPDVLAAHVKDPVVPPSQVVSGISPEVDAIVLACLEKDPKNRPRTGPDLLAALDGTTRPADSAHLEAQLAELPSLIEGDGLLGGTGSLSKP